MHTSPATALMTTYFMVHMRGFILKNFPRTLQSLTAQRSQSELSPEFVPTLLQTEVLEGLVTAPIRLMCNVCNNRIFI